MIDVECEENQIINAIESVILAANPSALLSTANPYGSPGASRKIIEILEIFDFNELLPKKFYDAG